MRELKVQLGNALLVVLTVAAVIAAAINFQQQSKYRLPDDGISWGDRTAGNARIVEAILVDAEGPGARAALKPGDRLISINGSPIESAIAVPQVLARLGPYSKADYLIERRGIQVKVHVYVVAAPVESAVYYQYVVGASYLLIGVFVYLRRGNASKARHFYVLCLVSFVLSCFHYTGKLNNFDKIIYWGNLVAGLYAPTIFLHFCLTFPESRPWLRGRAYWLYLPATLLTTLFVLVGSGSLRIDTSLPDLRWMLDRVWLFAYGFLYLAGAFALHLEYRRTEDSIIRQQLKWLRNGAVYAITPFTVFYLLPYGFGMIPGDWHKVFVLSLVLLPLTWAYAIIRYRLMDVDIIFQQGYAYTLATVAVIGIFYLMVFSFDKYEQLTPRGNGVEDLTPSALIVMILIATIAFQPIRNWLQELLDRYLFYKDRYDYRRTLTEFARDLSAETDLDHLLESVIDRLKRTLVIRNVAVFLCPEGEVGFAIRKSTRNWDTLTLERLDLSFLNATDDRPLFFERTRNMLDVVSRDLPATVRLTIGDLDFTYYVPCRVRGRTIAWLGVSRTETGDFLSSDDVDLLVSLAGYLAIAIENARLYQSLERKADEFERLKEFSENIVESINVGILAADLDDRVESWNAQLERLTGISRDQAVGCRLPELLPADLCARLEQVKGETGVHHVLKFTLRTLPGASSYAATANGYSNGNGHVNGKTNGHANLVPESVVNLAVAPLVSKDQRQIGRLVIFDDITERSELERQLVQADKLSSIGLLAAGVAHEVNTPLAVISSYAQMLAKQVSEDDSKSKLLEKIAKQTFRASEIVNSLLNFSRTSPTEFEDIDINRVLRETLSLIEHQLKKARVEVVSDLTANAAILRGNAGKLQQVFLNLFLNARDSMETHGGRLRVQTRILDDVIRVEVSDSGPGIAPEHLARIYDPFFTTKGAKKGTGLGLAVTYGIVKEHSGHIEVESEPGQGATFLLDFPLVRKPVHA